MSKERFTAYLVTLATAFVWALGFYNPVIHALGSLLFAIQLACFPHFIVDEQEGKPRRCPLHESEDY